MNEHLVTDEEAHAMLDRLALNAYLDNSSSRCLLTTRAALIAALGEMSFLAAHEASGGGDPIRLRQALRAIVRRSHALLAQLHGDIS